MLVLLQSALFFSIYADAPSHYMIAYQANQPAGPNEKDIENLPCNQKVLYNLRY